MLSGRVCEFLMAFPGFPKVKSVVENDVFEPAAASAFLILDDETIFEVLPNSVMNIGRLESNDVILDDYKVSREHAVLKHNGREIVLVDLASTYGTFVNGERVDRTVLQFDDRIQMANHELVIRDHIPDEFDEDVEAILPKMARSLDRRLKFFGGLNDFSLITLVQFLAQEKQSGLLLLEMGQKPGPRLYFEDGEIIHVDDGENLTELLTRQHHEESLFFYFHHETHFPERTIQEPTANFLMSLCQNYDQSRAVRARATPPAVGDPLAVTARIDVPEVVRGG